MKKSALNVGIDLEKHERFKPLLKKEYFMSKIYTQKEIEYIDKKGYKAACGIFCVKEAFAKCIDKGILSLKFQDISVERENSGRPILRLGGAYRDMKGEISISHSGEYTTAVCITEKKE